MSLTFRAVFLIVLAVLPVRLFGQVRVSKPVKLTPYINAHKSGRRIVSSLEILEFHVPRFAHVTKGRDVDYVEYHVRYGPSLDKMWLNFMFGPSVGENKIMSKANASEGS